MRFIKELLQYFAYITTGTVIAFASFASIMRVEHVSLIMVFEIPVCALINALITEALFYKEQTTQKKTAIVFAIHFILICISTVGFGLLFDWIRLASKQILLMLLCVVFVYAFTLLLTYLNTKKEADAINKALTKKFSSTRR